MDKNYNGEELIEFKNSWLFSPIIWDVLLNKYIPVSGENRNYIAETMFDKVLSNKINEEINCSSNQNDRILWELLYQR